MSRLTIFDDRDGQRPSLETDEFAKIEYELNRLGGVRFERWEASVPISPDADQDAILAAYEEPISRLKKQCGYKAADVVRMRPDHPEKIEFRKKFLSEHTHYEDEVRFFVEGSGAFYLHMARKVLLIVCEQGDLLRVPARTTHWFDMGPNPFFTAIRLFGTPEGWVAQFTGNPIADRFPRYGE